MGEWVSGREWRAQEESQPAWLLMEAVMEAAGPVGVGVEVNAAKSAFNSARIVAGLWTMEPDFVLPEVEAGIQVGQAAQVGQPGQATRRPDRLSESLRLFATTACCLPPAVRPDLQFDVARTAVRAAAVMW